MPTVASNPVPVSIVASTASIPAPTLNATPSVTTADTTVDLTQVGSFSQDHLGQSAAPTFSTVSPAAMDLQSIVSVDDIDSLLSVNWNLPDIDLAPKSLSESGYPTSHRAHGGTSDQSCRNPMPGMLPLRSTSTSLMDPNLVLRPLKVGYDNVGRVGVVLARFSFFGDDVLQVSTLKGKGSKLALNAHKLEALYSFMHNREPFCHFNLIH